MFINKSKERHMILKIYNHIQDFHRDRNNQNIMTTQRVDKVVDLNTKILCFPYDYISERVEREWS